MVKSRKLFIFGTSDYAFMVNIYFKERSEWEVAGFVVDAEYKKEDTLCGLPVVTSEQCEKIYPPEEYDAFVAIGYKDMNRIRAQKMQWLKERGYHLASYIDLSSRFFENTQIGENCFIMENVVIQPGCQIGAGVYLGSGVCIGHDTKIQDCSFVAIGSMIAGYVTIGANSFIGANSTISNGIRVADYTLVGATAYITKDTTKYGVYLNAHSKNLFKNAPDSEQAQRRFF